MLPIRTCLTCYQCVVVFEKNAQTVQKLAWGAVPPLSNSHLKFTPFSAPGGALVYEGGYHPHGKKNHVISFVFSGPVAYRVVKHAKLRILVRFFFGHVYK